MYLGITGTSTHKDAIYGGSGNEIFVYNVTSHTYRLYYAPYAVSGVYASESRVFVLLRNGSSDIYVVADKDLNVRAAVAGSGTITGIATDVMGRFLVSTPTHVVDVDDAKLFSGAWYVGPLVYGYARDALVGVASTGEFAGVPANATNDIKISFNGSGVFSPTAYYDLEREGPVAVYPVVVKRGTDLEFGAYKISLVVLSDAKKNVLGGTAEEMNYYLFLAPLALFVIPIPFYWWERYKLRKRFLRENA